MHPASPRPAPPHLPRLNLSAPRSVTRACTPRHAWHALVAAKEYGHDEALEDIGASGSRLMLGTASASASVAITIEQDGFGSGPIKVALRGQTEMDEDPRRGPHASGKIYLGISSGSLVWYRILQPMGSIYQSGEFLNGWGGDGHSGTYIGSTKHMGGIESDRPSSNACNAQSELRRQHRPEAHLLACRRARAGRPFRDDQRRKLPALFGIRLGLGSGRMPALCDDQRRCG